MVSFATLAEDALARAQAAGLLDLTVTEAFIYENIARIDNYGLNAAYEGSLFTQRLRYGLNLTSAFSREDPRDGSEPQELTVGPSLFGNARVAYALQAPLPTLALAVQYQRRRLADRALDGGFSSTPTAPPHVECKLTASGDVRGVSGLSYRVSGSYAFSRVSAYVLGPFQYAVDERRLMSWPRSSGSACSSGLPTISSLEAKLWLWQAFSVTPMTMSPARPPTSA